MNSLPRLADILANLRTLHENDNTPCPGPSNCPLLAIMGDVESLMDDVAKDQGDPEPACVPPQDIDTTRLNFMEANADERWWFISGPGTKSGMTAREAIDAVMATGFHEDDPEFQAADLLPEEPDTTAIADAIIRAQSNPAAKFLPAQRICILCEKILTDDEKGNVCPNCQQ